MNENTEQLLEKLADKLGTTTEYLWTVLVSQAKYDFITSAIQMAVMAAFIYWTIKLHIKFSKKDIEVEGWSGKKEYQSIYYQKEEAAYIPMIFAGITSMILIIFFLNGFNDLLASVLNPEYWALRQIIHFIH